MSMGPRLEAGLSNNCVSSLCTILLLIKAICVCYGTKKSILGNGVKYKENETR